jgi:uncharacterized repeat protein (TIGR01451 family)
MLFALRNVGVVNTTNLVGILLAGNGVAMTDGSETQTQNYGAVLAGGVAVSRPYVFRAVGVTGDRIVATLVLREGINGPTNGVVTFSYMLGSTTYAFANANRVEINDNTNASPYPSIVHVSGVSGPIQKVSVTVSNLYHTWPGDIDVLLVGPQGQSVILMSDAGSSNNAAANNLTLTFDDATTAVPPYRGQLVSGTFHPSNFQLQEDAFPAPSAPYAPINPPYATNLSVFAGGEANGDWQLYVVDDTGFNSGYLAMGWSLNIMASDPVAPTADLSVSLGGSPSPVPPSGLLTYGSVVTNHGPFTAHNVDLTNTIRPAVLFAGVSVSQGTYEVRQVAGGIEVVGHLGTVTVGAFASMTVQVTAPASNTQILATASTGASQKDINPGDNSVSLTIPVTETPRLSIALVGSNLVLFWPQTSGLFVLESSPTLYPVTWTLVPQQPVLANGFYRVTLPLSGAARFYRLRAL